jgi:hypothetical protein
VAMHRRVLALALLTLSLAGWIVEHLVTPKP